MENQIEFKKDQKILCVNTEIPKNQVLLGIEMRGIYTGAGMNKCLCGMANVLLKGINLSKWYGIHENKVFRKEANEDLQRRTLSSYGAHQYFDKFARTHHTRFR